MWYSNIIDGPTAIEEPEEVCDCLEDDCAIHI